MKIIPDARITIASPIGPITLEGKDERLVAVLINSKAKSFGDSKTLQAAKKQIENYFLGK